MRFLAVDFRQCLQGKFTGQFEQGILQNLFGGQLYTVGETVIEAGGDRVEADQKFFHGILLIIKVSYLMHWGLTSVIKLV